MNKDILYSLGLTYSLWIRVCCVKAKTHSGREESSQRRHRKDAYQLCISANSSNINLQKALAVYLHALFI